MKQSRKPLAPVAVAAPEPRATWRQPVRWVWRMWTEIDRDVREPGAKLDWRPLVVLVAVAVSLTLQETFGARGFFMRLEAIPIDVRGGDYGELLSFAWWIGSRVLGFLFLPMLVIAIMPGERLRDYHLSLKGFTQHWKLYLVLFALVMPLIFLASRTHAFQNIYPFYRGANRSRFDFWSWEAMYAVQFLALEFFFRGFMLKALAPSLGIHSVWVMCVPYCMIHFGKTVAETLGAIIAGMILGTIALRTRSIWGGVVIHIAVAITMDLCTVGMLPTS